MNEFYGHQKQSSSNFLRLLQERIEKTNPRSNLTNGESKRLTKLKALAEKLKRGENVQNRQLQTWLSETSTYSLSMSGKNSLSYVVSLKINQAT